MIRFGLGIILGIVLSLLGFVLISIRPHHGQSIIERFQPVTSPTRAAGTDSNYAQTVPVANRIHVALALADSGVSSGATSTTDLINLEISLAKAEVHLIKPVDHWEVLNLTQPTVELYSLRGSGAVADLGTTDLATGSYQTVRVTLSSIKGRRSNGQVVDVTFGDTGPTFLVDRPFSWNQTIGDIQLVVDLDTSGSLTQRGNQYFFTPKLRRVIQNDQEL